MIMGPHHMAPSEHGHVRARVGGIMPSRDRVSAPSLQEGPSLLVLGGVWQPRAGPYRDVQRFNTGRTTPVHTGCSSAVLCQITAKGARVHGM